MCVKMNKKLILTIFLGMFLISLVSASSTIKGNQGECVSLFQSCPSCSYVNLTSILSPTGNITFYNVAMDKSGVEYTYEFCNTTEVGDYIYNVCGDKDGLLCENIILKINPRGNKLEGSEYIGTVLVWVFLYVFIYFLFNIILKAPLWNFIGWFLITANGLIGVVFINNILGLLIMGVSILVLVTKLWAFLSQHLSQDGY